MSLKLTVYKDETMAEVEKVVEADKLKIPYRVIMNVMKTLDEVNLDNTDEVFNAITKNVVSVDKIVKATFGVSDRDLDKVNAAELIETGKEIYKWAIDKVRTLNKEKAGNAQAAAKETAE